MLSYVHIVLFRSAHGRSGRYTLLQEIFFCFRYVGLASRASSAAFSSAAMRLASRWNGTEAEEQLASLALQWEEVATSERAGRRAKARPLAANCG